MPKVPEKSTAVKTTRAILSPLQKLVKAFKDRYESVLRVIDDALASENLRDRIWAAELLMKRAEKAAESSPKTRVQKQMEMLPEDADENGAENATPENISGLSDDELLSRIEAYLYDAPRN